MIARDYERWGNSRHRHHQPRRSLSAQLMAVAPTPIAAKEWDHIDNQKGKTVWCYWRGIQQSVQIVGVAPSGSEGQRWYVQPISHNGRLGMVSVRRSCLELHNPYALAIVKGGIKNRLTGRPLKCPAVIYL